MDNDRAVIHTHELSNEQANLVTPWKKVHQRYTHKRRHKINRTNICPPIFETCRQLDASPYSHNFNDARNTPQQSRLKICESKRGYYKGLVIREGVWDV